MSDSSLKPLSEFSGEAEAAGYLAAMIDGEGCVSFDRRGPDRYRCAVRIANTDRAIIDACVAACDLLGVRCSVRPGWRSIKSSFIVHIGGQENLCRLAGAVQLRSPDKAGRLAAICARQPKRRRWHPDDRPLAEAREMYLAGRSSPAIAACFDASEQTVLRWLRATGTKIRTDVRYVKHSDEVVAAVRAAVAGGMTQKEACQRFNLPVSTCSMIVNHKTRRQAQAV